MEWGSQGDADETGLPQWAVLASVVGIVVFALFIRTYWNVGPAFSGGTFELSGNDPYYHKRAIDYIQNHGWSTLLQDPMLAYPYGSANPNPPLFEWSVAVTGAIFAPLLGGIETSTWWVFEYSPAVFGALSMVPTFYIGRHLFDTKTGLMSAFVLATATSHIERSALGFADHDAPVLFFILLTFYFYLKAVDSFDGRRYWVDDWSDLASIESGLTDFWSEHRPTMGYAVLAGVGIAATAQIWKGFPYSIGIIFLYSALNMLTDHWGNRDSTGVFLVTAVAFFVGVIVPVPYYAVTGLTTFLRSAFFIVLAEMVMGMVLVPTRDLPFVLVLPIFVLAGAIGVAAAFLLVPSVARSLLYSLVYFRGTVLYSTIAEAQPADINAAAFSIGPVAYLVAMTALFYLAWRVWKEPRQGRLFMFTWAAVAIFMAHSAVRFMFNATPALALLAGWGVAITVDALRLHDVRETFHQVGGTVFEGLSRSVRWWHVAGVVFIGLFVVVPNVFLAVDAGMPSSFERDLQRQWLEEQLQGMDVSERRIESASLRGLYQLYIQQRLQQEGLRDTQPNREQVQDGKAFFIRKRFGAFGQGFLPGYWKSGLNWLQDRDGHIEDRSSRPAFLSWWDYGHWAIYVARHPTVADNFQNGYKFAGNFIISQNETSSIQLMAARYQGLFERDAYEDLLVEAGVDRRNASAAYNALDNLEYTPYLDKEEATTLVERIEEETCTLETTNNHCKEIGYFAADVRLMPFDNPDTPRVEQPSIFYAPVTLAGENPDNFTQVLYRANQPNPFEGSPRRGTQLYNESELNKMVARSRGRQGSQFQPQGQQLQFKQPFFNSMFYKTYVGRPPRQILSPRTSSVTGSALQQPLAVPQPGFNLDHFRLVYMNDQLRMVEFYQGAKLNGSIVNSDGEPLSGVRVTAYDDAGNIIYEHVNPRIQPRISPSDLDVPHASSRTNRTGNFTVEAPFSMEGEVTLVFERRIFQGRRPTLLELGRASLPVSREAADEGRTLTPAEKPALDIRLKPAVVTGTVFEDVNGNGTYEPGVDTPRTGMNVSIAGRNGTTDANGTYRITGVPAGSQPVTVDGQTWRPTRTTRFAGVTANETNHHNVSVTLREVPVSGDAWRDANDDGDRDPGENVTRGTTIEFVAQDGPNGTARDARTRVGDNGTYETRLKPGDYVVRSNVTADGSTWRVRKTLSVPRGSDPITLDLQYVRT